MNLRLLLAALLISCLACAHGSPLSTLPYCETPEAAESLPDRACQGDPEFVAFREEIERFVRPRAGPLLVRVRLDDRARIADACVDRGYGGGQWTARRRLSGLLEPDFAAPSGPACAAGSQLEVNRAEATYELIEVMQRDCARQSNSSVRLFAECLDIQQQRRGEIWIYGSDQRYRVFTAAEASSPRRDALLACTERDLAAGSGFFPPIGVARPAVVLEECMEAEGWSELK